MISFLEFISENIVKLKVSKSQADEIQTATLETSDDDFGKIDGNYFIINKNKINDLIRRWKTDYESPYGLEIYKAKKNSMIKLLNKVKELQ